MAPKVRGNPKKMKAQEPELQKRRLAKQKARRYSHQRARDLLRDYYASPSDEGMNAILTEFDKMIEAVLFRTHMRQYNEADDYRQAARLRLWQLVRDGKIDPDDAFGSYLNKTFIRAMRAEAQRLYRQQFKRQASEERISFGWSPEFSGNPEKIVEDRETLETARAFCEEHVKTFRFQTYPEVYLLVVEYYFVLGYMPKMKDIYIFNWRADPDAKIRARFIYTAAVIHARMAIQKTLQGERFHREND